MVKRSVILSSLLAVFMIFAPLNAFSASSTVVINEVQIAGINTNDDFIELYNKSDTAYDLTGHRLVKRTAGGTTDSSIKAFESGTTIPAHGYYLWANKDWDPGVIADATTSANLAANNGIALRNGPEDTGTIVDSVAWGTVTNSFIETNPFTVNPDANTSMQRTNGDDTDNNSNDFTLNLSPNPQNSSATQTPSPSPSPTPTQSPSPTPTESPSPSPEPSESPSPSPTSTQSPSPSPSPSPTQSPSPSPSPTPTESPSPSPTAEPSDSPSPTPTVTPTPSSAPRIIFLGAFPFGDGHKEKYCFLTYKQFKFGLGSFWFPKIKCVNI